MIRLVEALNYRCLRYVRRPLHGFHVLVGPNGSGKTSFLDVLTFLGRLQRDGLDAAIGERTSNFYDLTWGRSGSSFEIAVEATIPVEHRTPLDSDRSDSIRYEIAVGIDATSAETAITREQVKLFAARGSSDETTSKLADLPQTVFTGDGWANSRQLLRQAPHGDVHVTPERSALEIRVSGSHDYELLARRHRKRSILEQLSGLEFPASEWLRELLASCPHAFELSGPRLRAASAPGQARAIAPDGSNVPWIVDRFKTESPGHFPRWREHLATALSDLEDVRVTERPEDRHRYLMLRYSNGLEVPSWMASEGTLRLIALTLLAYSPDAPALCLVEEPEISIHPLNVEIALRSLQSSRASQVLVTTHSPTVLASVEPKDVLVFSRDPELGTRVTAGPEHEALMHWRGTPDLGVLYAGGVLG